MQKIKGFIKKYFASFSFFYSYLRGKVFIALGFSIAISFLDGLGLSMFFPLLQVVDGNGESAGAEQMGKLGILVDGIKNMGIPLTLVTVLVVMVVFFMLKGAATYLSGVYQIILQQGFIRGIRLRLLSLLNKMSFKQFITSDVGRIQNTMTGEVSSVAGAFNTYFGTFQQAVMVAVYLGFAFFLDTQFAILVTIGGGLTNFLYRIVYKHTRGASRKLTQYGSVFQGQIIQHVGHFKYLKATGMVEHYAQRLRNTIYKIEESRRKIATLGILGTAAREPMLVIIIAGVIFLQVQFFEGAIGTIIISLLFFYRALTALVGMQQSWNAFIAVSGSLENMQDFQKRLSEAPDRNGTVVLREFRRSIVIENVGFSYGDTPILTDIQLILQKNESVAFVGESGSGKTTLVSMIAGLLPESEGRIYIDDTPLEDLKKETYQYRIGFVSQDPVIFNDTIYNNVTFWAPKTDRNILRFEQSIQQASLNKFVEELPKGMETELGNNGINLSGGQKQRVSIARELFKDIDILILDEATSALDSETERAIQKSIDALHGQYTILMVAHRLSTIRNADRIVFMDKGRIVDIDNFNGLLGKQERFRRMVELQEL